MEVSDCTVTLASSSFPSAAPKLGPLGPAPDSTPPASFGPLRRFVSSTRSINADGGAGGTIWKSGTVLDGMLLGPGGYVALCGQCVAISLDERQPCDNHATHRNMLIAD